MKVKFSVSTSKVGSGVNSVIDVDVENVEPEDLNSEIEAILEQWVSENIFTNWETVE